MNFRGRFEISNEFSFEKKHKYPIIPENQRKEIVESIKYVDEVFYEESYEKKREYVIRYKADVLVMGHDHVGKFDYLNDICKIIYLRRTSSVSSTEIIEKIQP